MNVIRVSRILGLALVLSTLLVSTKPVRPQSGNQSDITGPSPQEIAPTVTDVDLQERSPQTDDPGIEVDRDAFESSFASANFSQSVEIFEQLQSQSVAQHFGLQLFGETTKACEIAESLDELFKLTSKKPALLYIVSLKDQLELLAIIPQPDACADERSKANNYNYVRKIVTDGDRDRLQQIATQFRAEISNPRRLRIASSREPAQQLYQWIISPLEPELEANQIDTLIFSLDRQLRSIPMAALYNGQEFLIEKYAVGLIPSFSLTDTRYRSINDLQMLAFGVSESTQGQSPLPSVAVEIPTLADRIWQGKSFLNQESTIDNLNLQSRQQRWGIIHIATHAEFQAGEIENSYIQFWNDKLGLDRLRQLSEASEWNADPKVEMLVLSACRTALGNESAELGFSGLALQAGVKTAIGSLWYASDAGSLALMSEFYRQLKTAPIRVEALRQAQLAMLKGQVQIKDGQLLLSDNTSISMPIEIFRRQQLSLSHPYYWSAYTTIGNWN